MVRQALALGCLALTLLAVGQKKPEHRWEPRWLIVYGNGPLDLATLIPFSDGMCVTGNLGDLWGDVFSVWPCLLMGGREIRWLGFGVAISDHSSFSIGNCDARLMSDGAGEAWSLMEFGDGRDPGNCIVAPAGDDLDEPGDHCWIANPDPQWLSDDGNFQWGIGLGDGDASCPDGTNMNALVFTVLYEERWL